MVTLALTHVFSFKEDKKKTLANLILDCES